MNTYADKTHENTKQSAANGLPPETVSHTLTFPIVDNRPEGIRQRKIQTMARGYAASHTAHGGPTTYANTSSKQPVSKEVIQPMVISLANFKTKITDSDLASWVTYEREYKAMEESGTDPNSTYYGKNQTTLDAWEKRLSSEINRVDTIINRLYSPTELSNTFKKRLEKLKVAYNTWVETAYDIEGVKNLDFTAQLDDAKMDKLEGGYDLASRIPEDPALDPKAIIKSRLELLGILDYERKFKLLTARADSWLTWLNGIDHETLGNIKPRQATSLANIPPQDLEADHEGVIRNSALQDVLKESIGMRTGPVEDDVPFDIETTKKNGPILHIASPKPTGTTDTSRYKKVGSSEPITIQGHGTDTMIEGYDAKALVEFLCKHFVPDNWMGPLALGSCNAGKGLAEAVQEEFKKRDLFPIITGARGYASPDLINLGTDIVTEKDDSGRETTVKGDRKFQKLGDLSRTFGRSPAENKARPQDRSSDAVEAETTNSPATSIIPPTNQGAVIDEIARLQHQFGEKGVRKQLEAEENSAFALLIAWFQENAELIDRARLTEAERQEFEAFTHQANSALIRLKSVTEPDTRANQGPLYEEINRLRDIFIARGGITRLIEADRNKKLASAARPSQEVEAEKNIPAQDLLPTAAYRENSEDINMLLSFFQKHTTPLRKAHAYFSNRCDNCIRIMQVSDITDTDLTRNCLERIQWIYEVFENRSVHIHPLYARQLTKKGIVERISQDAYCVTLANQIQKYAGDTP